MKKLAILLAGVVILSLGFTVIDKNSKKPAQQQSIERFNQADFSNNPYQQSRKDIATWD